MKIVLGTPMFAVPRPWHYFPIDAIMVNAYDILTKRVLDKFRTETLHEILQCDIGCELWIDSGGYQFLRHGIEPKLDKILEVYKRFDDASYYLTLDYPPSPQDDEHTVRKKLEKSYENYVKLRRALGDKVVPVLHYHYRRDIVREYLKRYLDENPRVLAVGALVPYILILRGVRGNTRREALRFLQELRQELRHIQLHVLGLGSPVVIPILELIGVDSTDSSTWRVKAAYGKVVLPGGGEVHVTSRSVSFGKKKATPEDIERLREFLKKHNFPLMDRFERIFTDFEMRALVNCFVVLKSREPPRARVFAKIYNELLQAVASSR